VALGNKQVLPGGDPYAPNTPPGPVVRRVPFTPVCWALIVVCVAVFLGGVLSPGVEDLLVLNGEAVRAGQWWRVFTWAVVHGGPLHLFFNLTALWSVGRGLEFALRSWRFLLVTLVGALGSAAVVLAFDFSRSTVGLSGVILAWAGAALPLLSRDARKQVWLWLAQVAVLSLLPGVSWAGHLGGFVFGVPFGVALRGGTKRFATVAPFVAFLAAVLAVVAGSGRLR
jgi:membrane associated rhomboid family serine protease